MIGSTIIRINIDNDQGTRQKNKNDWREKLDQMQKIENHI